MSQGVGKTGNLGHSPVESINSSNSEEHDQFMLESMQMELEQFTTLAVKQQKFEAPAINCVS
jgi:hypothetical protein